MKLLERINIKIAQKEKILVLLIDPENYSIEQLSYTLELADKSNVEFLLLGGSLVSKPSDKIVDKIKSKTDLPVVLFPGSLLQLTDKADALFLLSLISGRNPELLIGNHVIAAPYLAQSNMEIIPTGYILIGDENTSSVEYMSNTKPIPPDKSDLITATALAGEMLGMQLIYLEAGSGANKTISTDIIKVVKKKLSIPLIYGGGIRSEDDFKNITDAGADIIVIGNAIEKQPELILQISEYMNNNKGHR